MSCGASARPSTTLDRSAKLCAEGMPPVNREHLQTWILIGAIAVLLAAIVHIYETQTAMVPHNLEGHSTTEGAMTANPPN